MKLRLIALVLVAVLMLGIFTACGKSGAITEAQAQKIALEAAELTEDEVSDVHTHVTTIDGIPCYSVHITSDRGEFSLVINASTGEIMD